MAFGRRCSLMQALVVGLLLLAEPLQKAATAPLNETDPAFHEFYTQFVHFLETTGHKLLSRSKIQPHHVDEEHTKLLEEEPLEVDSEDGDGYDFIIVGGGTSGAVLANRLTEIPEFKVLLLDAGHAPLYHSEIPGLYLRAANTDMNWLHYTEPNEHACLGYDKHSCKLYQGHSLGGMSSINDMLLVRGNRDDYDRWADEGNEHWCYESMQPYLLKIEDSHLKKFDEQYHRKGGPERSQPAKHCEQLFEAAHELGFKTVDYNGKEQVGIGAAQISTKKGRRAGTYASYLEDIKDRDNLKIIPDSRVVKVLIGPHTKVAQGVKFVHDGKLRVAKANKEVILAAGPLQTPHLLMLSGVGEKHHLEEHHIDVISDRKVGAKIRENMAYTLHIKADKHPSLRLLSQDSAKEWYKHHSGPLAGAAGMEAVIFADKDGKPTRGDYPHVQLIFSTVEDGFDVKVIALHPDSCGRLEMASSDPFHPPKYHADYLSDKKEKDLKKLLAGIRLAEKITETDAMKSLDAMVHPEAKFCEKYTIGTDEFYKCSIQHHAEPTNDRVGGCAMGPIGSKGAVVSKKLQVHGVKHLRVADASVIPVTMSGNIYIPSMIIGEKAADIIKEEYLS